MLVCNVSLRPRRAGVAADIAEAVTATDATATGNIVFATLVDDPASVGEVVDAYLGEIMLEAASATDIVDGTVPAVYAVAVNETAVAVDTPSATSAITTPTWDPTTIASVTLSGGNLVATNTGTTATNQGARVANASGKTAGKFYFEVEVTSYTAGANFGAGIGTITSTYTGMGNSATAGVEVFSASGNIWANGSNISPIAIPSTGWIISIAADLDNRQAWIRRGATGPWNANTGSHDPATNVGGITIPAGTIVPFVTFGGTGGVANGVMTANFGASTFNGAVPAGFTAGWPA